MTGHHKCPRCGADRPQAEKFCGFCGQSLPEVRMPTADDIQCKNPNCREWFHRALTMCPMCDTPVPQPHRPIPPVQMPVQQAPPPVHEPMIPCPRCGRHMPRSGRFCPYCSLDTAPGMGTIHGGQAQRPAAQAPYANRPDPGYIQRDNYNPGGAALGACLIVGLGQMINGQAIKGVVLFMSAIILAPLTSFIGSFILGIIALIDAVAIGNRLRDGQTVGQWQWF